MQHRKLCFSITALLLVVLFFLPLESFAQVETDPIWTAAEPLYAKLNGRTGGQKLIGGSVVNTPLILQANTSTSGGNTATFAALRFRVGDFGSLEALTILNNGNIGIGTISPQRKLDIDNVPNRDGIRVTGNSFASSTSLTLTNITTGGQAWDISSTGGNHVNGQGRLLFGVTYGAPFMTMMSNGNVGIGTTTPNQKLDISSNGTLNGGILRFSGLPSAANTVIETVRDIGVQGWKLGTAGGSMEYFRLRDSSSVDTFSANTSNGGVVMGRNYAGSVAPPSNGLVVESTVTIGATSPISALTIGGTGASNGLNLGTDVNLYNGGTDVLMTDDAFTVNQPGSAGFSLNKGSSSAQLRVSGGSNEIVQYGAGNSNVTRATFGVGGLDANLGASFDMYSDGTILFLGDGGAEFARFTSAGKLGVGLTSVDTDYLFQLPNDSTKKAKANAWDTYSDGRIKQNQKPLGYGLSEVLKLSPKQYTQRDSTWKNGKLILSGGKDTIGLVAQEVNKVLPEVVQKPKDESKELWSMDYSKIVPVLVNAIKEQQTQIEDLKTEVSRLKNLH